MTRRSVCSRRVEGNFWRRVGIVIAALLLASSSIGAAPDETRATMKQIFGAMQPLLLQALSAGSFADPKSAAEIGEALTLLEGSSAYLAKHADARGVAFAHLGALLAADAKEAHKRWDKGDPEAARFLVLQMTETCVACHSRLPSKSDAALSRGFASEADIAGLAIHEKALVYFATRQFGAALDAYEALMSSAEYSARDIDMMGHLDEYLELCIRVRSDPGRAIDALERFAARKDAPRVLKQEVSTWVDVLRARPLPEGGSIDDAQRLVDDAREATPGHNDRDALVEYLVAGSILHRRLESGIAEPKERARAFYLLGVIDTRIGRSFWLSQAETFLEAAIRTAPGTELAGDAFELLEEYTIAGYTGSGGEQIPADVAARLDALRALLPEAGSEA